MVEAGFSAALFIWNDDHGAPGSTHRTDVRRAENLIRLALRWTSQQRQLAWDVTHDHLTGLTNRGEFQNALDSSRGGPRAVLFCDLDDFKPVNERCGHRVGDQVLATVGERLLEVCASCVVARVGGDEFAILLREAPDLADALEIAARIQGALVEPVIVGDDRASLGATIGVAFDPAGAAHSDLLMDEADRLLREGKVTGKRQVLSVTLGD